MTLGERLKALRREIGLSQEAVGAQGFLSAPGWIKIENGQRHASEKALDKIVLWLVRDGYLRPGLAAALKQELLTLKYLGSNSLFLREMAIEQAKKLPNGAALIAGNPPPKPKRGRPPVQKLKVQR